MSSSIVNSAAPEEEAAPDAVRPDDPNIVGRDVRRCVDSPCDLLNKK